MQEKVTLMGFSVRMEISLPRDKCFGGNSAQPRYPPNTVIPRDGNFDTHLKPMKDTYNIVFVSFRLFLILIPVLILILILFSSTIILSGQ